MTDDANSRHLIGRLTLAAVVAGLAARADARVICRQPNGTLVVRDACAPDEHAVNVGGHGADGHPTDSAPAVPLGPGRSLGTGRSLGPVRPLPPGDADDRTTGS